MLRLQNSADHKPELVSAPIHGVSEAVYEATRLLLRATSPEEATSAIADAVQKMGGTVLPSRAVRTEALPFDISLGEGEPLVVVAEEGSDSWKELAVFVPMLIEDARLALELNHRTDRLARDAGVDQLTGLHDRHTMSRLMARLKPKDLVVAIDIDDFERIYELHGRDAADNALRSFARAIRQTIRANEYCGRVGNDQFLMILNHAQPKVAHRLLTRLQELWTDSGPMRLTFSAAIAVVTEAGWRAAMHAADRALLRAKGSDDERWQTATDEDYA